MRAKLLTLFHKTWAVAASESKIIYGVGIKPINPMYKFTLLLKEKEYNRIDIFPSRGTKTIICIHAYAREENMKGKENQHNGCLYVEKSLTAGHGETITAAACRYNRSSKKKNSLQQREGEVESRQAMNCYGNQRLSSP